MPENNPYAALPSISSLLDLVASSAHPLSPTFATVLLRDLLNQIRQEIGNGRTFSREEIERRAIDAIEALFQPRLSPVFNATGVILHTNLGRSPVSDAAAEAMRSAASEYVALEVDPRTGKRGGRMSEISRLMSLLTGAEATLVVNNNAAAVLLTLSALASGKSVVVSRGEAVEIGGGFRIPDVLRQSGARLVEVGTTNRTYARDYRDAVDEKTAVFLKVHPSNFSISGFTASASIAELSVIGHQLGIAVVEDLGSGALIETSQFGLASEPTIGESVAAGADLITASGDKLLGGPQAGIIAGKREWVEKVERHPLARAVRADKTCLAGVAATLRHYVKGEAESMIPVWRMISASEESVRSRGHSIVERISNPKWSIKSYRLRPRLVAVRSRAKRCSVPQSQSPVTNTN